MVEIVNEKRSTKLSENHEEADKRLILHSFKAADGEYEPVLVICYF